MESNPDLPDGLTALHVAVLQGDREQLRALLKSREYGADVRSRTGVTPLMLACMYGRTKIFFYLVKKKADPGKKDYFGFTAMDYVRGSLDRDLTREYEGIATGEPCRNGRRTICGFLRGCEYANKHARPRRPPASDTHPPGTRPLGVPQPSTLFLRSGRQLEFVEVRCLAATEVDIKLGRKSTGLIRGKNDRENVYKFSISGWAGCQGKDVLCNSKYSNLVRRICGMYEFDLIETWLDYRWSGNPEDKKGSYLSSHAEKQLGAWVLMEALSRVLKTEELTIGNIAKLKVLSPQLPAGLRETVIELDHEPCSSCKDFLRLLHQKAGIAIQWQSRRWCVDGKRSKLRYRDGRPVAGNVKNTDDTFEDEIDMDELDDVATDDSSATMAQDYDAAANANADPAVEGVAPNLKLLPKPRLLLGNQPGEPYPKGRSPIWNPPPRPPRYGQVLPRFTQATGVRQQMELAQDDVDLLLE